VASSIAACRAAASGPFFAAGSGEGQAVQQHGDHHGKSGFVRSGDAAKDRLDHVGSWWQRASGGFRAQLIERGGFCQQRSDGVGQRPIGRFTELGRGPALRYPGIGEDRGRGRPQRLSQPGNQSDVCSRAVGDFGLDRGGLRAHRQAHVVHHRHERGAWYCLLSLRPASRREDQQIERIEHQTPKAQRTRRPDSCQTLAHWVDQKVDRSALGERVHRCHDPFDLRVGGSDDRLDQRSDFGVVRLDRFLLHDC